MFTSRFNAEAVTENLISRLTADSLFKERNAWLIRKKQR
jgi:hypothetical protein